MTAQEKLEKYYDMKLAYCNDCDCPVSSTCGRFSREILALYNFAEVCYNNSEGVYTHYLKKGNVN